MFCRHRNLNGYDRFFCRAASRARLKKSSLDLAAAEPQALEERRSLGKTETIPIRIAIELARIQRDLPEAIVAIGAEDENRLALSYHVCRIAPDS